MKKGFPNGFVGSKDSACNAGDTGDMGSVPRLERSPAEGNGNPLQYSCLKKIPWTEEPWWAIVQWVAQESDMTEQLST